MTAAAAAKIVIRVLASVTALVMCASPAPSVRRIHIEKALGSMPALPLVVQWSYNHTWMLYGYLVREYFPVFVTYALGSALSIGFLFVYYRNASDQRGYVRKLIACAFAFNVATTLYTVIRSSSAPRTELAHSIGVVAIFAGLLMYASPGATVVHVVRTKSAASIPIAMVVVGTISNTVWIVYGLVLDDLLIAIPTVVNASFGVFQLALCAAYHPRRTSLKATIVRLQCRLARNAPQAETAQSTALAALHTECELSHVPLETPKYAELRSPLAVTVHA